MSLFVPFHFETDDDIWWRHNCVSWLIKSTAFSSQMHNSKVIVYLTIIMVFSRIIHRLWNLFYWCAGSGFHCSSALCMFCFFSFWFVCVIGNIKSRKKSIIIPFNILDCIQTRWLKFYILKKLWLGSIRLRFIC